MKKLSVIIIICLSIILSACGQNPSVKDSRETTIPTRAPAVSSPSPKPKASDYTLTPALEVFVKVADSVGKMKFSDCKSLVDSYGIKYDYTAPTKNDTGEITANDGQNELYISSYPNNNGTEIVTLVAYSDSTHEASVTDGYHLYTVSYDTFDRNATKPKSSVSTVDDLVIFIFENMKVDAVSNDTASTYHATQSDTSKPVSTPKPVNTPKPAPTPSSSYSGSYDATLSYGGDSVLICASEDAMDRYMTALSKSDRDTINSMIMNGEIAFAENNTKCNIVQKKLSRAKVTLLDGVYEGNTVWVIIEALQEK